jgi:transposase
VALPTLPYPQLLVTLGVDTHADSHVAAALDQLGRALRTRTIPTTPAGYAALLAWAATLGTVDRIGVEGTGSYGAGLARWPRAHHQVVIEVDRPDRSARAARRRQGKADDLDAYVAAQAVQAGTATATPKTADGTVEMIRSLRLARRSAVKARTQAANQLKALLVTAPDPLRAQLGGLPLAELVTTATRLRPDLVQEATLATPTLATPATPTAAAKLALRSVARRWLQLTEEITHLELNLVRLVAKGGPSAGRSQGRGSRDGRGAAGRGRGQPQAAAQRGRVRPAVRGWRRSPPPPARPPGIGSAVVATARRTGRCT